MLHSIILNTGCREALSTVFVVLCRAVYELTAVVAHVVDAAEEGPAGTAPEGHLVAHVKVICFCKSRTWVYPSHTCFSSDSSVFKVGRVYVHETLDKARYCTKQT